MPITVTLHKVTGADDAQRTLLERAAQALQSAINTPDFADRVRSAPYAEMFFRLPDGRRVTKTPDEVVAILTGGVERDTDTDSRIDLELAIDPTIKPKVVGVTTVGRLPFRTAQWFVDACVARKDTVSPARHMIHEWLHVAGFVHRRNDGYRRDVAYLVGDIVRQILTESPSLFGAQENEQIAVQLQAALEQVHDSDAE